MHTRRIVLGGAVLLSVLVCGCRSRDAASAAGPADFWVAPDGNDAGAGTMARPFATFARARDAVRALRQAKPDRDVLVLFRSGMYSIVQPVDFLPEDSGRAGGQVTYAAAPGAKPVISSADRKGVYYIDNVRLENSEADKERD